MYNFYFKQNTGGQKLKYFFFLELKFDYFKYLSYILLGIKSVNGTKLKRTGFRT